MDIKKLFEQVKSNKISKGQFLYEVRRDPILKKWISNMTSFNDSIKILRNKGLIVESTEASRTKAIENAVDIGIDAMEFTGIPFDVYYRLASTSDSPEEYAQAIIEYHDSQGEVVDDETMSMTKEFAELVFNHLSPSDAFEDNEPWTDPAGGTHQGNEDDPAAMYVENGPDDEDEWEEEEPLPPNWDGETEDEYSGNDGKDPEEKFWNDHATWAERHSGQDDDDGEFYEGKSHNKLNFKAIKSFISDLSSEDEKFISNALKVGGIPYAIMQIEDTLGDGMTGNEVQKVFGISADQAEEEISRVYSGAFDTKTKKWVDNVDEAKEKKYGADDEGEFPKKNLQKAMKAIQASRGSKGADRTGMRNIRRNAGLRGLDESKKPDLTIDAVNPYEYKRGLEYELGMLYTSATFVDLSREKVEKMKKKVLEKLSRDPYFYFNKVSGQKITPSKDGGLIELKDKNTIDKERQLEKAKGQKKDDSNVKDTLGKKEAGKSTQKIKIMVKPGEKYKKLSLKEASLSKYSTKELEDMLKKTGMGKKSIGTNPSIPSKPIAGGIKYTASTVGSSRGESFTAEDSITEKEFLSLLNSSEDFDDFLDEMPFEFSNILNDQGLDGSKTWKQQVQNIFSAAKKGKVVIACWEEGTTGLYTNAVNKKEAVKQIKLADREWMEGDDAGNISKYIKGSIKRKNESSINEMRGTGPTEEKIDMLEEAADLINEAIGLIEDAVRGTSMERSADAYIISHLSNWANGENPYDETIPRIIEELESEDGNDDEDDDDEDPNQVREVDSTNSFNANDYVVSKYGAEKAKKIRISIGQDGGERAWIEYKQLQTPEETEEFIKSYDYSLNEQVSGPQGTGLVFITKSEEDLKKMYNLFIRDDDNQGQFYCTYYQDGSYFFFPEEPETFDALEQQLQPILDQNNINGYFETTGDLDEVDLSSDPNVVSTDKKSKDAEKQALQAKLNAINKLK